MMTLFNDRNILIQLHKSQLEVVLGEVCAVRISTGLSDKVIEVMATVQTLTNCYLLSITDDIYVNSTKATFEIIDDRGTVVFSSSIDIINN